MKYLEKMKDKSILSSERSYFLIDRILLLLALFT